ncbi:DUF6615 family protein [Alteriqipengyuania lutimaris]|uniref:Uncharacterized protein n=1 Tax=Alteriqipengyuania lutimaris TaxID=1538146 RepID=A0A395LLX5_9SPHN|nr:DUF6615 family protein [Alteriqipengyuania lutimaris]MBB3034687.1 hypothetical protein [Alteriqipengyuania lutimaris]RDS76454.1 hypothetical protein DL238_01740 [Alteriqipengyuania lutimaris]
MSTLTAEQACLLSLARMVWSKRAAAKAAGLSFNEETVTETLLLDLESEYPGSVQVVAFNKTQEAKTGADWLWSFVSADGNRSLTMLVQAKRLEDAEENYPGIKRNIGRRPPPVRQIDQLIATATAQGVPALYAFYNHVGQASRVPKTCRSLVSGDPDHVHGFGVSLADAHLVQAALPDETFDTHRSHSIPLHCLLCSEGSGARPGGGTPEMAARSIARLRDPIERDRPDGGALGLRDGLHPLVELALGFADRRADDGEFAGIEKFSGIDGVLVLRDAKPTEQ